MRWTLGGLMLILCIPATFAETIQVPDFQRHVIPLLGRLGCNGSKCHGSFQGRGGLRLSLFGYDFEQDHKALTERAQSKEKSLILLKPTRQVSHKGGKRFDTNSWEHQLLLRWIQAGAKGVNEPRQLQRLEATPSEIVFSEKARQTKLKIVAVWANGDRENVTRFCRFRSNDDSVAIVNKDGQVNSQGKGDTHIVVFYDNGVVAIPVLRPVTTLQRKPSTYINIIDRLVDAKLRKLGIQPSKLCSDVEFLRRASIDMIGTLPTPTEVEVFLRDTRKDKRTRKIDELLKRPTYAAWWTNKLCDFTGCSPTAITNVTEVGQAQANQWYNWIYKRVADNVPYDKLVEGIVLSHGQSSKQSSEEYNKEMSNYVRRTGSTDFAKRETMPHYWTRQSVKSAKDKALAFAHSFLGVQMQCAECHKHPFDQWTQHDFKQFTAFFDRVDVRGRVVGFPQFEAARIGRTISWPSLMITDGEKKTLRLLRSQKVTINANQDPRQPIMRWMREKDNPWFARAFVNRVWAGYFHQGIVDPPDAFTPANPPSNPALLSWLTKGFIDSGYDMKWLHRQIANSETYQRSWRPNATNREDRRNFSRMIPRRIPAEVIYDAIKQVTAASDQLDEVRNNLRRRASGYLSMRMAGTYAMNVFGKPERAINCDCERVNEPTLLQSVFMQNDPLVRMRLDESGWVDEIRQTQKEGKRLDVAKLIRTAWLRSVNRPPTDVEIQRAKKHLAKTSSLDEGLTDLLWALMNTKEFLLNH